MLEPPPIPDSCNILLFQEDSQENKRLLNTTSFAIKTLIYGAKNKISNISVNTKVTETWHQYCALRDTTHGTYVDVAMMTLLVPVFIMICDFICRSKLASSQTYIMCSLC